MTRTTNTQRSSLAAQEEDAASALAADTAGPAAISVPHGAGGVYVIGEDGVRRLVERTADRVLREADEINRREA